MFSLEMERWIIEDCQLWNDDGDEERRRRDDSRPLYTS